MRAQHSIDANGLRLSEGERGDLPWWSFTKLILATAALSLVELGRLELDQLLPGRPYTLRQLLQHEAGLPDYGRLETYHSAVARGDAPWAPEEMISRALEAYPPWEPGSRWAYSNIGYYHVGELIRETKGENLSKALGELAMAPAGLQRARLVKAKADLDNVQMCVAAGYDPGWVLHGLVVGPLAEAATFLHRLLSGALLGEAMLAEMVKVRLLPQFRNELWEHPAYGLGMMGAWNGPGSPCGHSGEGPGSAIAVYGCAQGERVKVAASWQSPGTSAEVEKVVLGELAEL